MTLKPIDVTKPIETTGSNPQPCDYVGPNNRCYMFRERGMSGLETFDRYGCLSAFPSLGPLIRNVAPTDAEIVAARLAKAAVNPMKPTGLVDQNGDAVEAVSRKMNHYQTVVRTTEGFRYRDCDPHGMPIFSDTRILPAKDFTDE